MLNRNFNQRKALIRQQLNALITVGKIETTLARAKLVKSLFDKLASNVRLKGLHARRLVASSLANPKSANRLTDTIVPGMADKVSGFTKMSKLSVRRGDGATVVRLELATIPPKAVKTEKKKTVKPLAKKVKETK